MSFESEQLFWQSYKAYSHLYVIRLANAMASCQNGFFGDQRATATYFHCWLINSYYEVLEVVCISQ